MHLAISGRGQLSHITADPSPSTDPEYSQWSQRDSMIISWIIENIDTEVVNQFLDYASTRDL